MSRKTDKFYSVRTLRHNARKRTREIVQEMSDSDSESEYECTSRTRVSMSNDGNRYGPAHVHRAACSRPSRSTNYGIINSGLNPSFGEGTEVSASNALSLSVSCGEMDVNVPDLELDLADAPASLHIETDSVSRSIGGDSDDVHPNIDHESKSNDCESVTCTSVDGAAALLDVPIESNIGLDTDSAEWEDAPVTDEDLNEIMVSDTFRFSSRPSSSDTDDDIDDSENEESSKRNQLRDWAENSDIPL